MDKSEHQIMRMVLERIGRCRVCHREYGPQDVEIISRGSDMWTMMVECHDCHARNFVAAVLNEGDPEAAELALRRLSEEASTPARTTELPAEPTAGQVDAHDVVNMHRFLDDFSGDFRALFRGTSRNDA